MGKSARLPWPVFFVGIPLVAGIAVVGGVVLSWQGSAERAWADYAREARRQGTRLELTEFAEPAIPRGENFAAIPLWEDLFSPDPAVQARAKETFSGGAERLVGLSLPRRLDLEARREWMRKQGWLAAAGPKVAADVLQGLSRFDEPLAAIEAAGSRPAARFPVDWSRNVVAEAPHLPVLLSLASIYQLQMVALLQEGRSEEAARKFASGMRLVSALRPERALLSGLVRCAVLGMMINGVAEGLEGHQWNEAQLAGFDRALAGAEVLEDFHSSLAGERAGINAFYDDLRDGKLAKGVLDRSQPGSDQPTHWLAAFPGIRRQNQLRANQYVDELLQAVNATEGVKAYPLALASDPRKLNSGIDPARYLIVRLQANEIGNLVERFLVAETQVRLARVAVALERCRLARAEYPADLAELVPAFLPAIPRGVIGETPLHYQRRSGEEFRLYAEWVNQRDDGGSFAKEDAEPLDWVWGFR